MAVLNNTGIRAGASGAAGGGEPIEVENSLRFNDGDSAYLSKTFGAGNTKTFTWSGWVKRGTLPGTSANMGLFSQDSDTFFRFSDDNGGDSFRFYDTGSGDIVSERLFRDPSTWYHVVVAVDTTQSTDTNRIKVYINNEQITSWASTTWPTQNHDFDINSATAHQIGRCQTGGYFDGLISEVNFVDGLQLDASSFGMTATTGQWVPIEYTHSTSDWHTLNDGTTWSDYVSTSGGYANSPSNAFDGSTSTKCEPSDNSTVTFDFTGLSGGGIDVSSSLRIYLAKAGTPAASHFTVNGTNLGGSLPSGDWLTVSTSLLETITLYHQSGASSVELFAIEVDGSLLVDDAVDNSFYLKFDNTSDLGEDSSGNDNDFTANNLLGSITSLPCVEFDGSGDYLSVAQSTDWLFEEGDFTIEFWAYINNIATAGPLVTNMDDFNDASQYNSRFVMGVYSSEVRVWLADDGAHVLHDYYPPQQQWVHYAVTRETGNSFTLYKNGINVFRATQTCDLDTNGALQIGYLNNLGTYDGYISNLRIVKGTALYTADFTPPSAPLTNVTNTKLLCCQSDSSATTDNSDSSHTITANGDAAATTKSDDPSDLDLLSDSPSTYDDGGNGVGNYCTLNSTANAGLVLSNGNLNFTGSGTGAKSALATIGASSGKWYFEGTIVQASSGGNLGFGIQNQTFNAPSGTQPQSNSYGWVVITSGSSSTFYKAHDGTWTSIGTYAAGDVIGIAVDIDAGKIWFAQNGTWFSSGDPAAGTNAIYTNFTGTMIPYAYGYNTADIGIFNFGARSFAYTPPTGYKALNTFNLDDPTIDDPSVHFDVGLDTGADILSTATGLTDGADFVWIKDRANSSTDHILFNRINDTGMDGTPHLRSNEDDDESTCGTYSAPSGNSVAWVWNAGSSNTTISAGDLNSSAYDQSETWSDGVASSAGAWPGGYNTACGAITNGFNGNTSEGVCATASASIIWTNPQTSSTLTGQLEFYNRSDTTTYSRTITIAHAGGTTSAITLTPNSVWQDLGTYTGITVITVTGSSPGGGVIDAIKVGGKILVDDGVTPSVNVPSIASTVRANPSAGFSIVSYEGNYTAGATVGHGLNSAIDFILFKNRESTYGWAVYHSAIGPTQKLRLNLDEAASGTGMFEDTEPTSSVFTVGDTYSTNESGVDMIAYCWAPVEGYSKFGSYTANSSSDGPFCHCGFRPALVILKCSSGSGHWTIYDNKRNTYNPQEDTLFADTNGAENATNYGDIDLLSNGFKVRAAYGEYINNASDTFIWCAWAETPFKYSNAR